MIGHSNRIMAPKKPTRTELTEQKRRVVRGLINAQARHSEIKRTFAAQYGATPRAAERFIQQVYEQIREETARSIDDHRLDAYAYWQDRAGVKKLNTPGLTFEQKQIIERERDRARERLDKILGVDAPVKQAVTDTTGKDVPLDSGRRLTIAELDAELDKYAGGDKADPEPV